jgi:hypothetical protein
MVSSLADNRSASQITKKLLEVEELKAKLLARIDSARDGDLKEADAQLVKFLQHWKSLADQYGTNLRYQSGGKQNAAVIKPFNSVTTGWETLQSLRNVDVGLRLIVPTMQAGDAGAKSA